MKLVQKLFPQQVFLALYTKGGSVKKCQEQTYQPFWFNSYNCKVHSTPTFLLQLRFDLEHRTAGNE